MHDSVGQTWCFKVTKACQYFMLLAICWTSSFRSLWNTTLQKGRTSLIIFGYIWHSAMMKVAHGIWMSCEYISLSVHCAIAKQFIEYIATQILSWSILSINISPHATWDQHYLAFLIGWKILLRSSQWRRNSENECDGISQSPRCSLLTATWEVKLATAQIICTYGCSGPQKERYQPRSAEWNGRSYENKAGWTMVIHKEHKQTTPWIWSCDFKDSHKCASIYWERCGYFEALKLYLRTDSKHKPSGWFRIGRFARVSCHSFMIHVGWNMMKRPKLCNTMGEFIGMELILDGFTGFSLYVYSCM